MAGTTATLPTGINSSNNSAFVSYNRSSPHTNHATTTSTTAATAPASSAFELDDLAWVKLDSYPWWPARVINDPIDNYHSNYGSYKRKSNKNSYMFFYCVELFGQMNSHHWCPDTHMFKYEGKKAFMIYAQEQVNRANTKQLKQQLVEHFKINVQPDLRVYWESAVSQADLYARNKQVYVSNNTNGHHQGYHTQQYHHQFYEEQSMCLKRKNSIDDINFPSNGMIGGEQSHQMHHVTPVMRVDDSHKSKKFAMTKNNVAPGMTSGGSGFKKENAHVRTSSHYSNYSAIMHPSQQFYDNVQAFNGYKQQTSEYYVTENVLQNDQIAQQQYEYTMNHQGGHHTNYATTSSYTHEMTDYNGNTIKHSSSFSNLPNQQYLGDDGSYHQIEGEAAVEQHQQSSSDDNDDDEEEDSDSLLKAPTSIYQEDDEPGTSSQRNSISFYYQDQNGASSSGKYENEMDDRSSDEEESEGHTTITRILNEELAKKNRKQFAAEAVTPSTATVSKSVDTKSNTQSMSSSQHLPDNQLKLKIKLSKQDIAEQNFKSMPVNKKTKNLSDSSGDEDESDMIKRESFNSSVMLDAKKSSQLMAATSTMSHMLQSTGISQSDNKILHDDEESSSSSTSSASSSASSSCSASSYSSDTESEQKTASKLTKDGSKKANPQSAMRPNGFRKESSSEIREGRVVQPSLLKSKKNPSKSVKSCASNLKPGSMSFSKKVKSLGDEASSMSKLNQSLSGDPSSYMYGGPNQPQATETYLIDRYRYAVNHINQGLSIEEACNKYRISKGALMKCLSGGTAPRGKKTRLTEQEENQIVEWLISMKDLKYNDAIQMTFEQVVRIFEETKRQNPFNNGKPSMDWWYDFLSRHPQIMASKPDWLMRGKVNDQYIKDVQSGHLKCTKFRRALLSAIQYKNSLSNGGSGGDNGCSSTSESASSSSADMKLSFPLSSSQQTSAPFRSYMPITKQKFQHLHSVTSTSSKSKKSVNLKKKNAYSSSFSGVNTNIDHHHDNNNNKSLNLQIKAEPLQPITNFASKKEPMLGYQSQQGARDARSDETISEGERNDGDDDDDDEDNLDSVSPTSLMDQFVTPSIGLLNQNIFLSENNNSLYAQSNNNNSSDLLDTQFDKLINPNELIMNPNFRQSQGGTSEYYSYNNNNINDDFTIQNMLMTNGNETSGGSSSLASSSSSTSTSNNGHVVKNGNNFASSSSGYHLMIPDDDEEDSTNTTRASPTDINSTTPFLSNHHHHHHHRHHDDDEDSNDSLILNGNQNEVVTGFYDPTSFLS